MKDYTHEERMANTHRTLVLAQYKQFNLDCYEGTYYFATITREHEGTGYKIEFRRKTGAATVTSDATSIYGGSGGSGKIIIIYVKQVYRSKGRGRGKRIKYVLRLKK